MYWLHTDETNTDLNQGEFFIYGGLIATPDQMVESDRLVRGVREKYGFKLDDSFKFHTRSRPRHVELADWSEAKAEAISGAREIGLIMMLYVVSHKIAKNNDIETKTSWAMNALFSHYGLRFLSHHGTVGAVCIDRLPESYSYSYIEEMFRTGVNINNSVRRVPRVIHYSITSEGASHINTLVDLSLGGFRYSANAVFGAGRPEVAAQIMPNIQAMMWKGNGPNSRQIRDYGFIAHPKNIVSPAIEADYKKLREGLGTFSQGNVPGELSTLE